MEDLISISKCAALVGVHKSTLSAQAKAGLVRSHEGKVRLSEVLADRAQNIDLTRSGRRGGKIDRPTKSVGSIESDPTPDDDPTFVDDEAEAVIIDGKPMSYSDARALKESYLARLRQIEFHEKSGQVVRVEDVVSQVVGEYSIVRNKILGLPATLAPRLVGKKPDAISEILRSEITDILAHLSDPQQIAAEAVVMNKTKRASH